MDSGSNLLSISPENCPEEVYDLMEKCWLFKDDRPSFPAISHELERLSSNLSAPSVLVLDYPDNSSSGVYSAMVANSHIRRDELYVHSPSDNKLSKTEGAYVTM